MKLPLFSVLAGLALVLAGCGRPAGEEGPGPVETAQKGAVASRGLSQYWYQGKAEISRYELVQNRYGDLHPGEAILIFVTEDFLTDRQVKNESYQSGRSTKVLKTNFLRRFTTGIYDYSIMTSVFTPVQTEEFPYTLKVTASSQDWCGQSFLQINREKENYRVQQRSYFEREGDADLRVPVVTLEDELLNRIRMGPSGLPAGEFRMLPGAAYLRLLHRPVEAVKVRAVLSEYAGSEFSGEDLRSYRVEFPELRRVLEIVFEAREPYLIAGWTDSYPSAFDRQIRSTVAKRTGTILDDYWRHNSPEDRGLRKELGL